MGNGGGDGGEGMTGMLGFVDTIGIVPYIAQLTENIEVDSSHITNIMSTAVSTHMDMRRVFLEVDNQIPLLQ